MTWPRSRVTSDGVRGLRRQRPHGRRRRPAFCAGRNPVWYRSRDVSDPPQRPGDRPAAARRVAHVPAAGAFMCHGRAVPSHDRDMVATCRPASAARRREHRHGRHAPCQPRGVTHACDQTAHAREAVRPAYHASRPREQRDAVRLRANSSASRPSTSSTSSSTRSWQGQGIRRVASGASGLVCAAVRRVSAGSRSTAMPARIAARPAPLTRAASPAVADQCGRGAGRDDRAHRSPRAGWSRCCVAAVIGTWGLSRLSRADGQSVPRADRAAEAVRVRRARVRVRDAVVHDAVLRGVAR